MVEKVNLKFFYFGVNDAIEIHDWLISISGGSYGAEDLGLLESPIEHIKNDDYYPNIEDKLTHLVFSVNKNHAFIDGNKRSSIALGAYFLELNGFDYIVKTFTKRMENIAVWVADNVINKELLHQIIYSILYEDEFSESLKLEIYDATQIEI